LPGVIGIDNLEFKTAGDVIVTDDFECCGTGLVGDKQPVFKHPCACCRFALQRDQSAWEVKEIRCRGIALQRSTDGYKDLANSATLAIVDSCFEKSHQLGKRVGYLVLPAGVPKEIVET